MKNIILASASPRRREILENVGLQFDVLVTDADEGSVSSENIPVSVYVQELALLKATSAVKAVNKDSIIISADTVVVEIIEFSKSEKASLMKSLFNHLRTLQVSQNVIDVVIKSVQN